MRAAWVLAVTASLLAMPVHAGVLCRGKQQRVFARVACKASERVVELPKGATGPSGAPGAIPVRVVDATGTQVGLFAEPGRADSSTVVVFEAGPRLFRLVVSEAGFGGGQLYHLTSDCSDPPLVFANYVSFVRNAVVLGGTAYFADDPITQLSAMGLQTAPGPMGCGADPTLANGNCCHAGNFSPSLFGPATAALSTTQFVPPFRLEP